MSGKKTFIFVAVGSHGDVHPIVGIAAAMKARGHRCVMCVNGHFRSLVERNGLEYIEAGTAAEYLEIIKNPDVWHPRKGGKIVLEMAVSRLLKPAYEGLLQHWQQEKFVLVSSPLCISARLLHETHGVPLVSTQLQPVVMRSVHEVPGLGLPMPKWVPHWLIRAMFWAVDRAIVDPILCPRLNEFRRELGLPDVTRPMNGWWNSPQRIIGLWPAWFGAPQPDWPPQTRLAGFPLYDERTAEPLPPELETFLAEGTSPIAFTPGSAMRHGKDFFEAAIGACEKLQRRALLLTRFAENIPGHLPPSVLHVPYAPFSQLLPRCAAVVHHGGIGTLAQGFAAGIPQLLMPMAHDQPDNLLRLQRLGAGDGLRPTDFTPRNVAEKLGRLLADAAVQQRCRELRQRIADDHPLDTACALLEAHADKYLTHDE
ncbi:MAG TPA: glycosyltransferase [Candidatus Acidoferrum sp.]|nr:glycosyltransferase [Candidatus Acidoferrum sp.]